MDNNVEFPPNNTPLPILPQVNNGQNNGQVAQLAQNRLGNLPRVSGRVRRTRQGGGSHSISIRPFQGLPPIPPPHQFQTDQNGSGGFWQA